MSEEGKSSRWKVWAFLGLAFVIVAAAFLLQPQEQGSEGEPAESAEVGKPGDGGSESSVVPGEVEVEAEGRVDPFVEPADADDQGTFLVLPIPSAEVGTEAEGMVEPPAEPDEVEAEAGSWSCPVSVDS